MNSRYLELAPAVLDRWVHDIFLGATDDHVFDFRKASAKEQLFQQKENDWVKFGYSKQFLDSMRSQDFWDAQYAKVHEYNQKILRRGAACCYAEGVNRMFQFTLNQNAVSVPRTRICWNICEKTRA